MQNIVPITSLYAGAAGLLFALLSIRVPVKRAQLNAPWGDGGDMDLDTRIRVFGNLSEYLPIVLLLMAFNELAGLSAFWIHMAGAAFLAARLVHAVSLDKRRHHLLWRKAGRGFGASLTWAIVVALSAILLGQNL